jgi:hypothetical protein
MTPDDALEQMARMAHDEPEVVRAVKRPILGLPTPRTVKIAPVVPAGPSLIPPMVSLASENFWTPVLTRDRKQWLVCIRAEECRLGVAVDYITPDGRILCYQVLDSLAMRDGSGVLRAYVSNVAGAVPLARLRPSSPPYPKQKEKR